MSQDILVTGTLAYDSITSPEGNVDKSLGGSANFFSAAALHYAPVKISGVVGEDYRAEDYGVFDGKGQVSLDGVQKVDGGKTFHWKGKYEGDLSEAITLQTDLNVLAEFDPKLPESYKKASHVFLANIDPDLQLQVLDQVNEPTLVAADTMNFWIDIKKDVLEKVFQKIDILFINEGEANQFTGESNAIASSKALLDLGLKAVLVKRGEYGVVARTADGLGILPAYPVEKVFDPTGAGDSFAGATFGYLCQNGFENFDSLKNACVHGTVMASFTVEKFGMNRLLEVKPEDLAARREELLSYTRF